MVRNARCSSSSCVAASTSTKSENLRAKEDNGMDVRYASLSACWLQFANSPLPICSKASERDPPIRDCTRIYQSAPSHSLLQSDQCGGGLTFNTLEGEQSLVHFAFDLRRDAECTKPLHPRYVLSMPDLVGFLSRRFHSPIDEFCLLSEQTFFYIGDSFILWSDEGAGV